MRNSLAGFVFVPLFALSAHAGDGEGGGDSDASFDTPSHNMCCHYVPAGGTDVYDTPDGSAEMVCSRVMPKYWIVSLTENGRLKVYKNPGEVPGCGFTDVLGYGETRRDGPFTCTSRTSGITCKVNGKGFTLSKAGIKKHN